MKIFTLSFVFAILNCIVEIRAGECDKLPGKAAQMDCCKIPDPKIDFSLINKIGNDLKKDSTISLQSPLMECKVAEQFFQEKKLAKDKDIDKDATLKYIETLFDDAKFKEVFKGTFETCLKDVTEKIADIQKKYEGAPYNIKKDQCNVKFMAVNACSILDGVFKKCPDDAMNKNKDCDAMRDWYGKCRTTMNSFSDFHTRM